eukprot:2690971-Pyramimonas_sp.AAC.1
MPDRDRGAGEQIARGSRPASAREPRRRADERLDPSEEKREGGARGARALRVQAASENRGLA